MAGKSILIVDDEAPIREMIAVALEMAGYECLEAENTQQAHTIIALNKVFFTDGKHAPVFARTRCPCARLLLI